MADKKQQSLRTERIILQAEADRLRSELKKLKAKSESDRLKIRKGR